MEQVRQGAYGVFAVMDSGGEVPMGYCYVDVGWRAYEFDSDIFLHRFSSRSMVSVRYPVT